MKRILIIVALLLFSGNAYAASKFLIGCATTCTWDNTNDTIWSLSSGGANNTTHPVAADTVTLDASSCSGGTTCTITVNANLTITSLIMGACTASTAGCILDFSANNNSITMSGTATGFDNSGTGTRTLNMGNGTWTISGSSNAGVQFTQGTTTNLTFNANGSTILFSGSGGQSFNFGNKTVNNVTIGSRTSNRVSNQSASGHSINNLTLTAPTYYQLSTSVANTVNTSFTAVGTSTNQIYLKSGSDATAATLSSTAAFTCTYCAIKDVTFSGGGSFRASSSMNLGNNTGITFGGGGNCIIGGWLLWRDMPEHINDNFPAWLDKAA